MTRLLLKTFLKATLSLAIVAASALPTYAADAVDYNRKLNRQTSEFLKIPFYFNVPFENFLPLAPEILSRKKLGPNAALIYNYYESSEISHARAPESDLGLRLITVKGTQDRKTISAQLAASGAFEAGDVVLSFRKEWFRTLKYSHIQLGVSHAGILYYETGADGIKRLKNLDMPLDDKHVGQGYMNSEHYMGAPLLHVVRAKDLTDKQKSNLSKWLTRMAKLGPKAYADGKIRFNQDYSQPKYRDGQPMKFVGDIGRLALGQNIDAQTTNYCSEFVWSVLSLRNCDPEDKNTVLAFSKDAAPSCIQEIFSPMPVLGSVTTDKVTTDATTIGLADGVPLIARTQFAYIKDPARRNQVLDKIIARAVFAEADGNATNISSGHKAVEDGLLAQNPKFFEILMGYFQMTNDVGADQNPQVLGIRQGFNAVQAPNYSPTSFMVHAVLPESVSNKAFDYVGTIFYAPAVKSGGKNIETYNVIRRSLGVDAK
jgi:hypothetical protein